MSKIDLAKRRRVMQRSQKLGHCICDPRKPCPCDIFKEQSICPCAGERPDPLDLSQVRLTEMVHNAGCASKISPNDLDAVLSRLPKVNDPAVISGIACGDDAGIYRLSDDLYLVQTVDVMTPCCDDPHTSGRICAANCLSDIYAMGGVPRTALSILAFPSESLDGRIMYEMLAGAMEVLAQASVALIGGHSIKDSEIKLGFAITGTVPRQKVTANDSAKVGDLLVLTKPLGCGVLNFAHQIGQKYGKLSDVIESMARLNSHASQAAAKANVSACTDVTGFGLYGHLINIARHSKVTADVWADALPAFDGALEALRDGVVPGAIERNAEFVGDDISISPDVEHHAALLGFDAQTSGGLLLCVPADNLRTLLSELSLQGVQGTIIGCVSEKSDGRIRVIPKPNSSSNAAATTSAGDIHKTEPLGNVNAPCCSQSAAAATSPMECCSQSNIAPQNSGDQIAKSFGNFLQASLADGILSAKTKELITFSLVVLSRCKPCLKHHIKQAREMGISDAEMDEAAWCAVAMGGAPVRLFYLETKSGR